MSESKRSLRNRRDAGYTLLELVVTCLLIGILSAVAYSYVHTRKDVAGGEEQALRSLEQRLMERRLAAIRLNPLSRTTSLESIRQPPVEINLLDSDSTRSLVVEGVDANGDGYDDVTGEPITICADSGDPEVFGTWRYAYTGTPLVLPTGWNIASKDDLGSVPLISSQGAGEPVTDIFFTASGTAVVPDDKGGWQTLPSGAAASGKKNQNSPFWAIYVISADGMAAAAIAVHPSGALETWRWNQEDGWLGYGNRSIISNIKLY